MLGSKNIKIGPQRLELAHSGLRILIWGPVTEVEILLMQVVALGFHGLALGFHFWPWNSMV